MRATAILIVAVTVGVASGFAELGFAELNDRLSPSLDHPAIEYFNYLKHPPQDAVSNLKRSIEAGQVQLKFDHDKRYLPAVL